MSNTFQPYSDPTNLAVIRAIGSAVVHDVAPDEELSVEKLTGSIAQAYEEGRLIVAGTDSKTPGGFGDVDLVMLVIVPVVIEVLSELGKQLLTLGIDALKKRIKEKEASKSRAAEIIDVTVEREYKSVNKKVKSKKARSIEKITKQALKIHIKKQLETEPENTEKH
jgi:hypothetical protein